LKKRKSCNKGVRYPKYWTDLSIMESSIESIENLSIIESNIENIVKSSILDPKIEKLKREHLFQYYGTILKNRKIVLFFQFLRIKLKDRNVFNIWYYFERMKEITIFQSFNKLLKNRKHSIFQFTIFKAEIEKCNLSIFQTKANNWKPFNFSIRNSIIEFFSIFQKWPVII
jgi:hypothetical protein